MDKSTNVLLKEVTKYALIILAIGLTVTFLITKTSYDILIIYLVGWATAFVNLFLLAYFIITLRNKQTILIGIPVFALRYVIYGLSMWKCINSIEDAIFWSAGVVSVALSLIIGGITSQKRKEESQ